VSAEPGDTAASQDGTRAKGPATHSAGPAPRGTRSRAPESGSKTEGSGAEGSGPGTEGPRTEAATPGSGPGAGDVEASAADAEPTVRDAISAPDAEGRPRRFTRRFPLFTRDTAPPEGGGRAADGDAPAPVRQWPILAVLATVGLGLLLTALDVFRVGTLLVGVALLGGAALRWALPDVGMLAVRSRFTDLATYGTLGVAIVLLAMMAQPNPWLVIPFLDDTLHFTIRT
jgi:hypothetical protein